MLTRKFVKNIFREEFPEHDISVVRASGSLRGQTRVTVGSPRTPLTDEVLRDEAKKLGKKLSCGHTYENNYRFDSVHVDLYG